MLAVEKQSCSCWERSSSCQVDMKKRSVELGSVKAKADAINTAAPVVAAAGRGHHLDRYSISDPRVGAHAHKQAQSQEPAGSGIS